MPRIRSIKPDFWESEDTALLESWAALTYSGLWNYSDDEGRMRYQPAIIHAKLHALRPDGSMAKTKAALDRLIERKLIILYESEAHGTLLYIPSFKKHQHPDHPVPSKYPTPPRDLTEDSPRHQGVSCEPALLGGEGIGGRKGIRKGGGSAPPASASPGTTEGNGNGHADEVTELDVAEAYRRVDPNIPLENCLKHIRTAVTRGVKLSDAINAVQLQAERLKLWVILDLLVEKKAGAAALRPHAPDVPKPPVLEEPREVVQKRRDDAMAKCEEILRSMDEDELAGWTRDAEAKAKEKKIPPSLIETFIHSELIQRIAKEHGIEGL